MCCLLSIYTSSTLPVEVLLLLPIDVMPTLSNLWPYNKAHHHIKSSPLHHHIKSSPLHHHIKSSPLHHHIKSSPLHHHIKSSPLHHHIKSHHYIITSYCYHHILLFSAVYHYVLTITSFPPLCHYIILLHEFYFQGRTPSIHCFETKYVFLVTTSLSYHYIISLHPPMCPSPLPLFPTPIPHPFHGHSFK